MAERRRPDDGDLAPKTDRLGDRSFAFAAALVLHAVVLLPFLVMWSDERRVVEPGASAVMVNIIRAETSPEEAQRTPESPAEKPAPPQPKPAPVEPPRPAQAKVPAPRAHAPAMTSHPASAPTSLPPPSSIAQGKPAGVAAAGASEAGVGTATAKAKVSYRDKLKSWLAKHKRYPSAARRLRIEGVAVLRFTVARDGRVLSHEITHSSGSEILDREVEEMLERAEPLPAFPPELKAASLDVSLPIGFELTD